MEFSGPKAQLRAIATRPQSLLVSLREVGGSEAFGDSL